MSQPMSHDETKVFKELSAKFAPKLDLQSADEVRCLYCAGHHFKRDCSEIICYRCKGLGHTANYCRERRTLGAGYGEDLCSICNTQRSSGSLCAGREAALEEHELGEFTCIACGEQGHLRCEGWGVTEWFLDNKCFDCL
jgi:hypothetical protein